MLVLPKRKKNEKRIRRKNIYIKVSKKNKTGMNIYTLIQISLANTLCTEE